MEEPKFIWSERVREKRGRLRPGSQTQGQHSQPIYLLPLTFISHATISAASCPLTRETEPSDGTDFPKGRVKGR